MIRPCCIGMFPQGMSPDLAHRQAVRALWDTFIDEKGHAQVAFAPAEAVIGVQVAPTSGSGFKSGEPPGNFSTRGP